MRSQAAAGGRPWASLMLTVDTEIESRVSRDRGDRHGLQGERTLDFQQLLGEIFRMSFLE